MIQFNSLKFAIHVLSLDGYNLLDNERIISLKIEQAVWNNTIEGNIKFYYIDLM